MKQKRPDGHTGKEMTVRESCMPGAVVGREMTGGAKLWVCVGINRHEHSPREGMTRRGKEKVDGRLVPPRLPRLVDAPP